MIWSSSYPSRYIYDDGDNDNNSDDDDDDTEDDDNDDDYDSDDDMLCTYMHRSTVRLIIRWNCVSLESTCPRI